MTVMADNNKQLNKLVGKKPLLKRKKHSKPKSDKQKQSKESAENKILLTNKERIKKKKKTKTYYKTDGESSAKVEKITEKFENLMKGKERKKRKKTASHKSGSPRVKKVAAKLETLTLSEKKEKKPLTERQKHKRFKLKMKLKEKKKAKKSQQKPDSKDQQSEQTSETGSKVAMATSDAGGKVALPKTPAEASSNWKKLQQTTDVTKPKSGGKKRKLSPDRVRNPKLRKQTTEADTAHSQPPAAIKKPDIWFDDVDEFLLEKPRDTPTTAAIDGSDTAEKPNPLVKPEAFKGLTKAVAMDCEMVGVGDGTDSMVARVSIVNQHGEPIYDTYVKPKERIVDYRTKFSGIRPGDMEKGEKLEKVQKDVADILKGRILVGHAIQNDLKVLFLEHPRRKVRDTSRYKAFRRLFQGRTPSLKNLSATVLHVTVQEGEHDSVQDAQAAMRLYTMFRQQWESQLKLKRIKGRGAAKTKTKTLPEDKMKKIKGKDRGKTKT